MPLENTSVGGPQSAVPGRLPYQPVLLLIKSRAKLLLKCDQEDGGGDLGAAIEAEA